MTSFGTLEEMIDFEITHPKDYDKIISGIAKPSIGGHQNVESLLLFGGGSSSGGGGSSGGSSHPGYGDGTGPAPNIADTNWEQRRRDIIDHANKAVDNLVKKSPEIVSEKGFEIAVKQALTIALGVPNVWTFILGVSDPEAISKDQDNFPLISSTAILTNPRGARIGRLVVSKNVDGVVRFTVYSTNPNPNGSFFATTTDGSTVSGLIAKLQDHSKHDSEQTNSLNNFTPSAGEITADKQSEKTPQSNTGSDTADQPDVEDAPPPDDDGGENSGGEESPVVTPLT